MSRSRFVLISALLSVCAAPVMATSIVMNGSFEDPSITGNYYECVPAYPGACSGTTDVIPAITGWTVGLTSVDVVQGPTWAEDGIQGIDMAGTPGPGSLTQILTTAAGTDYVLSFWVSSNGGPYTDSLTVDWDGIPVATVSSPVQGTWQEHFFSVTGTGSDTLAFIGNRGGNAGALLDNVNVDPVPEPATLGLIGAGLVFLALRFRRR